MIESFKTPEGKWSGRKLTAFMFTLFASWLHYRAEATHLVNLLIVDAVVISVCLGLVTIPELLKALAIIKQGKTSDDENKPA